MTQVILAFILGAVCGAVGIVMLAIVVDDEWGKK